MNLKQAFSVSCLGLAASAAVAAPLATPAPAPTPTPAAAPAASGSVPSMRFDEKGIGLLDAVRLTLSHDPAIKLRAVDVQRKEGVEQEITGQFDTVLNAKGQFQYSESELQDSTKQSEIDKRFKLDKAIKAAKPLRDSYQAALRTLATPGIQTNPDAVDFTAGITDPDLLDEMKFLQGELRINNDLIAATTDPKLKADFAALRSQVFASSLARFQRQYADIANLPEELQKQRDVLGDSPNDSWSKSATAHFDLQHLFRNGMFISPFTDLNYSASNYVGKERWEGAQGGQGIAPLYKVEIGFDVVLPLLRGRGREEVAASEAASKVDTEATRLLALHQQSQSVLRTIQAYWDLRSAVEQVDALKRSVSLQNELVDLTRQLIKAKEKARAEEARVLGSLASAEARLESAQRQVGEARVNLARVMGVALADVAMGPLAADSFPRPPATWAKDDGALATFALAAPGRRLDLQAAKKAEAAGKILVRGAELATRRRLDVNARYWINSVHEVEPLFDPLLIADKPRYTVPDHGPFDFRSGRLGLQLEVPFGNGERKGRLVQRQATLNQAQIDSADLQRTTTLNVTRLAQALRLAATQLQRSEDAVKQYDQTIVDERQKLRAGESTLVDTILTEQQTTSARISLVAAKAEYAQTLARLRYEAGLLVREAQGAGSVTEESLLAVPASLVAAK